MGSGLKMRYEDINVGQSYEFRRKITKEDIMGFAEISGDHNRLHIDEAYAKKTPYKKNIAHGMLAASLFSALVGMHCPGDSSLYLSQSLNFSEPVYPGDELHVIGTVIGKSDSTRIIILKTEIFNNGKKAVYGEAKVRVMSHE
jgi:acyl dehydratase